MNNFVDCPQPVLPLARYRLIFRTLDTVKLPAYAGSAWRGAFGGALKRSVCVTREPECVHCLLYRSCVYPYVFETPPDPEVGKLRKYNAAPHPFVLRPRPGVPGGLPPGSGLMLELVLFGHGNRYLPYVIHAFERAGYFGIGAGHGRLQLGDVEQHSEGDWRVVLAHGKHLNPLPPSQPECPPCPTRLDLVFETPLRIKRDEHFLTLETFEFGAFFGNLLRRISLLTAFHTDTPLETDFAGLSRAARSVNVANADLRWFDWTRYSARQQTSMQMGGLMGQVKLEGAGLEPFWPYLWLGQWTHAGKGTSMGLGRYRVEF